MTTIPASEFFLADLAVEISLDRYLKGKADPQDLQDLTVNLVLTQALDDQAFHGVGRDALNTARQALLDRIHAPETLIEAIRIRYQHLRSVTRHQFAKAVDYTEDYFGV